MQRKNPAVYCGRESCVPRPDRAIISRMHWHSVNLPRGQAPRLPVSLTELTNPLSPREPFQSAPVPTGRSKVEDFCDHERLHLSDDVDSERHILSMLDGAWCLTGHVIGLSAKHTNHHSSVFIDLLD